MIEQVIALGHEEYERLDITSNVSGMQHMTKWIVMDYRLCRTYLARE
jgi:hypothetical protein